MPGRVGGGFVQTPLGPVRAGGIPDGTTVQVLVRPEGIRLDVAGPGPNAHVMAARMLGRSSLVHLSLDGAAGDGTAGDGAAGGVHLHARVPGRFLPRDAQVDRKSTRLNSSH